MNSSDEFTSPVATSTVWKKKKPVDWQQEPETTFQELVGFPEPRDGVNKENIESINCSKSKSFGGHDESVRGGYNESTLNLWKYLVPSHPGEMEEDAFIVDEQGYEMNQSTPNSFSKEPFLEEIVEDIAKLDVSHDGGEEEEYVSSTKLHDDFDISPIPGFIITDDKVLIRRYSAASSRDPRSRDETHDTRKILSAPPSLVVTEAYLPESNHRGPSIVRQASFHDEIQNFPLDIDDIEEDLINESFSNYFNEELSPTRSKEQHILEGSDSPLGEAFFRRSSDCHTDELKAVSKDILRKSLGSSNTVPFIDPDASMTTEALSTPDFSCADRFSVAQLARDSALEFLASEQGVDEMSDLENKSIEKAATISLSQDTHVLDEIHDDIADAGTDDSIDDDTDVLDNVIDAENTINDVEDVLTLQKSQYLTQSNLEESNNTPHNRTADHATPEKVRKHPSFNSPELQNHSILDRILKDEHTTSEKQIIVPPTHTIDQACAVGIVRKFSLSLQNKTALWVQCSIGVDEVGKMNGYSTQTRMIIPPLADETLPVCLSAKQDGLCVGTVELTINSVISGMLAEQFYNCKVTAIAELPGLEMAPSELDFGIQIENKESSYEIRNTSDYELPLKVVLKSDGLDEVYSLSDPVSKYRTAMFALVLQPRQVFLGHIEFCPYEQYTLCKAKLQVLVDSPNGALLTESNVSGTVGFYKLRIPTDKHALSFESTPGEPTSTTIKLLNTGNLEMCVALEISRPFAVTPTFISSLVPGEEVVCEVSYFPVVTEYVSGRLTLSLANDAVLYQVPAEGRSSKTKSRVSTAGPIAYSLLASKSIVNFGGAEIGRQKEETLLLQNDSPTQMMCLVLRVISPSRSFYIVQENDILLSLDIVLAAGASQSIKLGYTPLHAEQHLGELLVKTKNNDVSFPVPLSGHGGISQVTVINAQKTSSRMWVDMGHLTPNIRNSVRLSLQNTGARAAFVSAVLENEEGYLLPSTTAWANPSSIVVPPNSQRDLFVIYEAGDMESCEDLKRLALLKLFCGDEIARHRFCKVLKLLKSPLKEQDLPFDPTLEFLVPDCSIAETEVKVPHLTQNDMIFERRLFGNGLYQLFISVMGRTSAAPNSRPSLVPLSRQDVVERGLRVSANSSGSSLHSTSIPCSASIPNSASILQSTSIPYSASIPNSASNVCSVSTQQSVSLIPTPENVSGHIYNISPSSKRSKEIPKNKSSKDSRRSSSVPEKKKKPLWSFTVDELKFNKACVFHVVNEENDPLVYEVSYEGQLFSVAPTAGCIPAYGCTEISIRPTALSRPFVSTLLVSAGGEERMLKVTYTPPSRPYLNPTSSSAARDGDKVLFPQGKSVVFQTIPLNTSSSGLFEFTNSHSEVFHWQLCSSAPAYRKVDAEEPVRVPYSAFCVSVISGLSPAGAKEKIPVTFYPKHVGHFTQCWDFTYFTESLKNLKHKRRIIFEGTATLSRISSSSRVSNSGISSISSSRPHDRIFMKSEENLEFNCAVNERQSLSFKLGNPMKSASNVKLSAVRAPFNLKYKEVLVEAGHSARIPVRFVPTEAGVFRETLFIDTDQGLLQLQLTGEAHGQ